MVPNSSILFECFADNPLNYSSKFYLASVNKSAKSWAKGETSSSCDI
jgi:hypothetical protein